MAGAVAVSLLRPLGGCGDCGWAVPPPPRPPPEPRGEERRAGKRRAYYIQRFITHITSEVISSKRDCALLNLLITVTTTI